MLHRYSWFFNNLIINKRSFTWSTWKKANSTCKQCRNRQMWNNNKKNEFWAFYWILKTALYTITWYFYLCILQQLFNICISNVSHILCSTQQGKINVHAWVSACSLFFLSVVSCIAVAVETTAFDEKATKNDIQSKFTWGFQKFPYLKNMDKNES